MHTLHSSVPEANIEKPSGSTGRLDYMDAARAFALLLGIVFHASLSFLPTFIGWAVQDVSTSPIVSHFVTVSHAFRLETFFLIAGFFGQRTLRRDGTRSFALNRAVRLLIPFTAGWFLLHPLIIATWEMGAASLSGSYSIRAGLLKGLHTFRYLPKGIFTQTHLWFLYYLAMISALFIGMRALLNVSGKFSLIATSSADRFTAWAVRSPLGLFACALPTAGVLWYMSMWIVDTPDQTLVPNLPVIAIYSIFFSFGWLLARQAKLLSELASFTTTRVAAAVVSSSITLYLTRFQMDPGNPAAKPAHVAFSLSYAMMMWFLISSVLAGCRLAFSTPRPWVRYIADASYWLYIIHLLIVIWLQVAIADQPLHWTIKLPVIVLVTLGIGLVSYDLFVRSTWVGVILNGRRRPRAFMFKQSLTPFNLPWRLEARRRLRSRGA